MKCRSGADNPRKSEATTILTPGEIVIGRTDPADLLFFLHWRDRYVTRSAKSAQTPWNLPVSGWQGTVPILRLRRSVLPEAKRASQVCGHPQALGSGAQLRMAGEEQAAMEKLRALTHHQPAIRASRISGSAAQKILDRWHGRPTYRAAVDVRHCPSGGGPRSNGINVPKWKLFATTSSLEAPP